MCSLDSTFCFARMQQKQMLQAMCCKEYFETRGPWIAHLSPGILVDDVLACG